MHWNKASNLTFERKRKNNKKQTFFWRTLFVSFGTKTRFSQPWCSHYARTCNITTGFFPAVIMNLMILCPALTFHTRVLQFEIKGFFHSGYYCIKVFFRYKFLFIFFRMICSVKIGDFVLSVYLVITDTGSLSCTGKWFGYFLTPLKIGTYWMIGLYW